MNLHPTYLCNTKRGFAVTLDELMKTMWSWSLVGELIRPNRQPLSMTAIKPQQMPVSYKSRYKMIFVIEPIFKHHPSIKSTIYYQHTTVICKLKDFMNSSQNYRILSRTVRFFMAKRFE